MAYMALNFKECRTKLPERHTERMDFVTDKQEYSVVEFYDNFVHSLPKIVMVSQGFCGEIVDDTLAREQIIRIETVSRQRRVLARSEVDTTLLSIPTTYPEKLCVVNKHGKTVGKEEIIYNIIRDTSLPCGVQFPKDKTIHVGPQRVSTNHIPAMELIQTFDEMYLLGNIITDIDGVMDKDVINVPLYLSQLRLVEVTGLKGASPVKWMSYLEELAIAATHNEYDQEFGNSGIAVYGPNAIHSDTLYSYLEPTLYSNIHTLFRRPTQTQPNTNVAVGNPGYGTNVEEEHVYHEIGIPREESESSPQQARTPIAQHSGLTQELKQAITRPQKYLAPISPSETTGVRGEQSKQPPAIAVKPPRPPPVGTYNGSGNFAVPERIPNKHAPSSEGVVRDKIAIYSNGVPQTAISLMLKEAQVQRQEHIQKQEPKQPPAIAVKPPRPPPVGTYNGSGNFAVPERIPNQHAPSSEGVVRDKIAIYSNDVPRTTISPMLKEAQVQRQEPVQKQNPKPKDIEHLKSIREVHSADDVALLTIEEVCEYMKKLKLRNYISAFKEQMIDGQMLLDLDTDMLRDTFEMKSIEALRLLKFAKTGHVPT